MTTDVEVLIVGAGLAGLHLADRLQAAGRHVRVLEARTRLGGRIHSVEQDGSRFDLGPTWFWAGQPRMAGLLDTLGLSWFPQASEGAGCFEDADGRVLRRAGWASMAGSRRVDGGMGALIDGLSKRLEPGTIELGARVAGLALEADRVRVELRSGVAVTARVAALAIPPRIAAPLAYHPDLPSARAAMRAIPTWMAGHAKVLAFYARPFWRTAGLSGDAISQRGPLAEIHDASLPGGPYALFGFVGTPERDPESLLAAARDQLVRLFSEPARHPVALQLQDWAREPNTAVEADRAPLTVHPQYGLPRALHTLWDDRLVLGGTEVAPTFGGYLEGALEAAEHAERRILARLSQSK